MPKKLISAQKPFTMLVAHLTGGSDPSKGTSGNPSKARTAITAQHFVEVPGRGAETKAIAGRPGTSVRTGHTSFTTEGLPVASTGTITVQDATLRGPTKVYLGDYVLTTGEEIDTTPNTNTAENITNTAPDSAIVIWKTAGAGGGEGTIDVPGEVPIVPGSVTIFWTSGSSAQSQTDDGDGGFASSGDGNPSGSSINYVTGAITLDTTGVAPDTSTTITITYDSRTAVSIATALESAIDDLVGYSASVAANVVTVTGPTGPEGNAARFEVGGASPYLFTLSPDNGSLSGAEPSLGPVVITS